MPLNKQITKTFSPTPQLIEAAQTVFIAMAMKGAVETTVRRYQVEILRSNGWLVRPEFREKSRSRRKGALEVIRDPKLAYLMSEADFEDYDRQCKLARREANLLVKNPDHCPLLEAETDLLLARHHLCDCMEPTTGLSVSKLLNRGLAEYERYIELTLNMLVKFVATPKEILAGLKTAEA